MSTLLLLLLLLLLLFLFLLLLLLLFLFLLLSSSSSFSSSSYSSSSFSSSSFSSSSYSSSSFSSLCRVSSHPLLPLLPGGRPAVRGGGGHLGVLDPQERLVVRSSWHCTGMVSRHICGSKSLSLLYIFFYFSGTFSFFALLPCTCMRSKELGNHVDVCPSVCPSVDKNIENTNNQLKYVVIHFFSFHPPLFLFPFAPFFSSSFYVSSSF